jgi:hypothetical protein
MPLPSEGTAGGLGAWLGTGATEEIGECEADGEADDEHAASTRAVNSTTIRDMAAA